MKSDLSSPIQLVPTSTQDVASGGDLTLEEKISLLAGRDDWHFHAVPRLSIPETRVCDCGHGVTLVGDDSCPTTCMPTGIGMASTWNAELLEHAGHVLGRETRAVGCSMLLGPKLNIHRIPLNGRSFETFSEDPWLAGLLGAAIIRGIQAENVGACVKAMAGNNQQRDQQVVSAEIHELALHELYLRNFELAIRHGQPCAVMTSYNRLNGDYAAENAWLISEMIKGKWRFPGLVLSDWNSIRTEKVYASGLDIEMPGPGKFFNRAGVERALQEGLLSKCDIDDKVSRILGVVHTYSGRPSSDGEIDSPRHRAVALQIAEESIVLLKNNGVLPLDRSRIKRILVTGPNAKHARLGGGGSASVTPAYSVSPLEGIIEAAGENIEVLYMEGCGLTGTAAAATDCFSHECAGQTFPGLKAEFYNANEPTGVPVMTTSPSSIDFSWGWASPGGTVRRGAFAVRFSGFITPPVSGRYKLGIFHQEGPVRVWIGDALVVDRWAVDPGGNFEERFTTRTEEFECDLEANRSVPITVDYSKRAACAAVRLEWEIPHQPNPLDGVRDLASEVDAAIVCGGLSNSLEGGACDRSSIELPTVQVNLIRAVSSANPNTIVTLNSGGPLAVPWIADAAALLKAWYPGQEGGRAFGRILFGMVNPSGRVPDTIPHKLEDHASAANYPGDGTVVRYEEGLSVGYRHFDNADIAPHFPFGFGLSYTTFQISAPTLSASQHSASAPIVITASVTVSNTGTRPGKHVVQLYVEPPRDPRRPVRELRAFKKIELQPGEQRTIEFQLENEHFDRYDLQRGCWAVQPGNYRILAGSHSRDLVGASVVFS